MTIRIAHCSDTHDKPSTVRQVASTDADLILLTGDCISNRGRVNGEGIIPAREVKYQNSWFRKQAKKWAKDIGDRPVLAVHGNHDFISVARWLRHYGVTVHVIDADNPCVELFGIRFAGFREIPWMAGEWAGETHDLAPCVDRAFDCDPDVLVTHAPPGGILDRDSADEGGYGIVPLMTALTYRPHRITHHFFGHAHKSGGKIVDEMGIRFINGAGHCRVHEVG